MDAAVSGRTGARSGGPRAARSRPALAVALLLAGCAAPPQERVREGEQLLARGDAAGAARAFDEVQRDGRATALDRQRAQVGEARAFLLKGDLVGARTRLRRLDEAVSDRWYLLGVIALREGDLAEAEASLLGALDRAHGGDTAALLARALAGEARAPDPLEAAAGVVERRDAPLAEALRAAAAAWRDAVAGRDAAALLERLAAVEARVGGYPAVRVLRARLLDRAGRPDEAAPLWEHAGVAPPPSEGFRAWASDQRARLALETGDAAALDQALAGADPATAARVRADLARGRAGRGDPRGALDAWRRAADTPGAPPAAAAEALAEAAWLEELLGLPSTPDAWARAQAAAPASPAAASPVAAGRVARRLAAQGDPVAGARLDPAALGPARAALDAALAALEAGREDEARRLARALRQLDPGGAAARALDEAVSALTLGERTTALQAAQGETRAALAAAALRLHLAQGDASGVTALLDRPGGAAGLEALGPALEAGLLRALEAGRAPEVIRLLERHGARVPADVLGRLRASAALRALPDAVLPAPRGPLALPDGEHPGALVAPLAGLELAPVVVGRRGRAWWLAFPSGTRVEGAEADLGRALGQPLDACAWTAAPAHDPAADLADDPPAVPVLEVR